jgi:hypothetical protein
VIISSPKNKEEILWISINLKQGFPMSTLAENFLSPSFGNMEDVVHIVIVKNPIGFQARAHGPAYTSAAGANSNLP